MMITARLTTLSLAICSLAALACSSGTEEGGLGGPNKCGKVAPCGGDLVGNWHIAGACVDSEAVTNQDIEDVKAACPDLTYETSYAASGTAVFNAANTYSLDLQLTVTATAHIPAACLQGLSCSALNALFQYETGGTTGATISCTGSSSCTCVISAPQTTSEDGTYTTSGTTLTTTPGSGGSAAQPYCVDGSTLHIISLGEDATTILADVIGKK